MLTPHSHVLLSADMRNPILGDASDVPVQRAARPMRVNEESEPVDESSRKRMSCRFDFPPPAKVQNWVGVVPPFVTDDPASGRSCCTVAAGFSEEQVSGKSRVLASEKRAELMRQQYALDDRADRLASRTSRDVSVRREEAARASTREFQEAALREQRANSALYQKNRQWDKKYGIVEE